CALRQGKLGHYPCAQPPGPRKLSAILHRPNWVLCKSAAIVRDYCAPSADRKDTVHRLLKKALLLGFIATALAASGRHDNTVTAQGPAAIYERGRSAMESSNYPRPIQYFKALEGRYPFSPETRQAQLDLISLYYKTQQPEQAIDAAETFEKENPTNARID